MKIEGVVLLTVACTLVHAIPRAGDTSQMKNQTSTVTSTVPPSSSGMSPESSSSMSTPNIADQEKQPDKQMETAPTQQETMNNMPESSTTGQESQGTGSQTSTSPEAPGQNMYQMGMSNTNNGTGK
ncbi:hypothetical protein GE061_012246 [Apolygus lucorum]|uniref:Uncharacterized protein n=1 Tax=Apolygus lucorum TaxID=248454 RepID=A0A6A4JS35_APOLU|nr:hypothetical protein GE061_012246 [Apolygus lucorum]